MRYLNKIPRRKILIKGPLILWLVLYITACAVPPDQKKADSSPLTLQTQGSFAVGGSTVKYPGTFDEKSFLSPEGQSAYGDHLYAFYQIQIDAHTYQLVFQHGGAQHSEERRQGKKC